MELAETGVVVDVATLELRPSGGIVGSLYFRLGRHSFPEETWTDFVVVILTWWCDALLRVNNGIDQRAQVRFMEGPYLVELRSTQRDKVRVTLLENRIAVRLIAVGDVSLLTLTNSVLVASHDVLTACRARGWATSDLDQLALVHGRLCS